MIRATPEERVIMDKFTRYFHGNIWLVVDHQFFRLSYSPENAKSAYFMRCMLAKALLKLMKGDT